MKKISWNHLCFKFQALKDHKKVQIKLENEVLGLSEDVDKLRNRRRELNYEITQKDTKIAKLKADMKNPIHVVRALTDDKFEFFDYQELEKEEQKKYYNHAQDLLKNTTLLNETAYLNKEFITWAAKHSQDFLGVRDMRHQISGLNLLSERLESIVDLYDNTDTPPKDPHSTL